MKLDSFTISDIESDVHRIETVIATNIFAFENSGHPLITACITEIMVCLNDLLQKSKKFGERITFTDDLTITPEVTDITDTVAVLRNALCHISSKTHLIESNKVTHNIVYGYCPNAMRLNDITIESLYADDVCLWFGQYHIYLNRHILRVVFEVKNAFTILLIFSAFPHFVPLQIPELAGVIVLLAIPLDSSYQ